MLHQEQENPPKMEIGEIKENTPEAQPYVVPKELKNVKKVT